MNNKQNHNKQQQPYVSYVSARKSFRQEVRWLEKQAKNNPNKLKSYKKGKFNLGKTPDVLLLLGVKNASVIIRPSVFWKVMGKYLNLPPLLDNSGNKKNRHNISPETLLAIPQALNEPVAVFQSKTVQDAYVLLIELKEYDKASKTPLPIVVTLHFNNNELAITSCYGKELSGLRHFFENDLLYINHTKAQQLGAEYGGDLQQAIEDKTNLTKNNSGKQVSFGTPIVAVKSCAETPLNQNSFNAVDKQTNGDKQVPYWAPIAAVPENCNQPRQNLLTAICENNDTQLFSKLQYKLKKIVLQSINKVKSLFQDKQNNTQNNKLQNKSPIICTESDLKQWRYENIPLTQDNAYQEIMTVYAYFIPSDSKTYIQVAEEIQQNIAEKYTTGKTLNRKQIQTLYKDFSKPFEDARKAVREAMAKEQAQTPKQAHIQDKDDRER
ncbi:MAG: hypothetical protein IJ881_00295 [Neisseriaceae bacterium]|nr:hypothetical protein [Neisseriaceae bacterium]